MLHRDYTGQVCSIARALEIVGERWTLLIVRDAFLGVKRYDEFVESLGIARNILSARLQRLCDEGILEQRLYQERPARHEYRLTEKGMGLWPVVMTLVKWGDRYYADAGPPRLFEHKDCGGAVTDHLTCAKCGKELEPRDMVTFPGPGSKGRRSRKRTAVAT